LQQFEFLELPKEPTGLEVYRGWRKLAKVGNSQSSSKIATMIVAPQPDILPQVGSAQSAVPFQPERLKVEYSPSDWAALKDNAGTRDNRWRALFNLARAFGYQGRGIDHTAIETICIEKR